MDTPNYIKSLVTPTTKAPQGRKVWSIDLETVWLRFFTATNAQGDTAIPSDALGAPLRLGYDKSGAVRFSQNGRPVIRVAKELADSVKAVRDNFTANLVNYAGAVMRDNEAGYKAQVELAIKAGKPIAQYDLNQLSNALKAQAVKAEAVTPEADKAEAVTPEADADKAEAVAQAEEVVKVKSKKAKEMVTA